MSAAAPATFGRHHLAWLDACAASSIASAVSCERDRDALLQWLACERPFVVARQVDPVRLALGLPLPPDEGKRRIALSVEPHRVVRSRPPLRASEALAHAGHLRTPLAALHAALEDAGIQLSVFGSIAWQALTGLRYVTQGSDIDALMRVGSLDDLRRAMTCMDAVETRHRIAFDGEIVFGDDHAVALREWRGARAPRVLVKQRAGVALVTREALLATLAETATSACC